MQSETRLQLVDEIGQVAVLGRGSARNLIELGIHDVRDKSPASGQA